VSLLIRLPGAESPEVLLIRRAEHEDDPWSGHVALPGGRRDASDVSLEQTALRETLEEVALDVAARGRVIGALADVVPQNPLLPRILIRPFVAVVDSAATPRLSAEVAEAFWVPVSLLSSPDARASAVIQTRDRSFTAHGWRIGGHFVWGLTERILRDFLDASTVQAP
jgi:8-oxo-dGTP pyrophosphatase MutT (NUDIX family)